MNEVISIGRLEAWGFLVHLLDEYGYEVTRWHLHYPPESHMEALATGKTFISVLYASQEVFLPKELFQFVWTYQAQRGSA